MQLDVNLPKLKLKNPILTASGTFGYGLEYQQYGELDNLGGMVVKGLSLKPRKGNPMPRIAETSCGMLNAIGLQNIGARAFVEQKLPNLPWDKTAVIANLYAQQCSEFAELAGYLAAQEGIAALEVNISCPNVKQGGLQFGQDPVMAAEVCQAVKDRAGSKPVIVKLSPNVTNIVQIAQKLEQAGADCLSLINTLSAMAVDIYSRKPKLANGIGGLSGPAIKPVALRMVYQVCQAVSIPVIGIGGIVSAEDVLEFILVGAHAVQIGSANFISPDRSFTLVKELEELCAKLDINNWADFRGQVQI
jgi:dihydroorotate dehydrogenase (NAD+) catalytic subunit